MFSRALKNHRAEGLEHLIVELKAPKVKLTAKETTQIKGYAFSVSQDERFRDLNTRWSFWLISNDMNDYVTREMQTSNVPRGVLFQADDRALTIWVKTWSEIFAENKARLQFFQEKLEHQVDQGSALKYLQERYKDFVEGVITEDGTSAEDQSVPVESSDT